MSAGSGSVVNDCSHEAAGDVVTIFAAGTAVESEECPTASGLIGHTDADLTRPVYFRPALERVARRILVHAATKATHGRALVTALTRITADVRFSCRHAGTRALAEAAVAPGQPVAIKHCGPT
jgi:hypothetical protein